MSVFDWLANNLVYIDQVRLASVNAVKALSSGVVNPTLLFSVCGLSQIALQIRLLFYVTPGKNDLLLLLNEQDCM